LIALQRQHREFGLANVAVVDLIGINLIVFADDGERFRVEVAAAAIAWRARLTFKGMKVTGRANMSIAGK